MSLLFGRYRPIRNVIALPVLLALVLSYFNVFVHFKELVPVDMPTVSYSFVHVPVDGSPQNEPVSSLSAEGLMRLSWIALGFAGQSIRSFYFSNFSRTFLRAGAGSEGAVGELRRPESSGTYVSVRLNPMVLEQVFDLRIARLKAG